MTEKTPTPLEDLETVTSPGCPIAKSEAYGRLQAALAARIDPEVCDKAVARWGNVPQMMQTVEECAELIQALNHWIRGRASKDAVAEEIADVLIMAHQCARIFGEDRVQTHLGLKLEKLGQMLGG